MPTPQIETYSADETQWIIDDAYNVRTSSHYGKEGSGYGVMSFELNRSIGVDYQDIGYGYRVKFRKYLETFLFDGDIRQIDEDTGLDGGRIKIVALGQVNKAEDDELVRYICDTRLGKWKMESEVPADDFRPDLFGTGTNEVGLYLHAGNELAQADDYTEMVYEFPADEVAERITCSLSLTLGLGNANGSPGPEFTAVISSISGAVITYTQDRGESNLAASQILSNLSKKGCATINSTGSNTITVSDADHISGWGEGDVLFVGAPLFEATISSIASAVITYSSPVGEDYAREATGWVLHNVDDDAYATVESWDTPSSQVTVTDSGDLSGWAATETIRIYAPYRVKILDDSDTLIWPESDWRQGAVVQSWTDVDILTTGSPTGFKIRFEIYVGGTGGESSFASLANLQTYSIETSATATILAQEVVTLLSGSGHKLSSDVSDIESVSKELAPMIFEYVSPAQALSWACGYGDGAGNLLAWGVRYNDDKTLFLETQDTQTIDYVVRRDGPTQISVSGDIQKSAQQTRGVYADKLGDQQVTDWLYDEDSYFEEKYRRHSVRLDNITDATEAEEVAQLYLDENKDAVRTARYSVGKGSVFTPADLPVEIDELLASGHLIAIEDWRSVETGLSGTDLRSRWTREQLVLVEIDHDNGAATMTPAGAKSAFDAYMAELSRIRGYS